MTSGTFSENDQLKIADTTGDDPSANEEAGVTNDEGLKGPEQRRNDDLVELIFKGDDSTPL